MDKQQAQAIIKETFENPFNTSGFTGFIKNLLNRVDDAPFTYQGNYIPDAYKQYIKTLERVGKFRDGVNSIDILVITLQKETSLERARTMQRNFIAWYLNGSRGGEMKEAALAAFVSPGKEDWRFSLVKMDYKFDKTKSGRMKVKEEFTPARRWSFLVGENEKSHTAQSRLVNILKNDEQDPTLEEIEKAFDIETVTKEFFLKYRELFLRTKEELDRVVKKDPKVKADFEAKGVDTVNFAKKLLGQIIFLYFLQKKGWFGVGRDDDWGTGSKHFLRELFNKEHAGYINFYNDILEPLFYEALRTGEDRKHEDYYYSRFDCKIPFLNGGLFDPIGNYDWVHTDILIPDKLFSNDVKTKEGDIGTGILDVFDRYNFTVKEDEPLEKEVAIDPELLGKSYEKFNAIRPDNFAEFKKALKSGKKGEENKFNKKFGVYYTPREIVHYMCQQSLINYLATELTDCHSREGGNPVVSKEDIEILIHTGERVSENEARVLSKGKETKTYSHQLPESIRKSAKLIDDKLAEITVSDPAVGSGAFPVGMMGEIVRARNVLSTFVNDKNHTPYEFKRRCIEHSLYGVDIDPGAVEIAKLRLWLSLVVDEHDIKNIKPLPNLDYRIMQGNSLIELLSTESLASTIDNKRTELVKELKKSKDDLFNITIPTKKENKRREIDILMKKLFEYDRDSQIKRLQDDILAVKSQQRLFKDDKDKKEDEKKIREIESRIEEIKNIDVPGPTEHFEWHVNYSEIFHEKGGFDVVIANPPYYIFSKNEFNSNYKKFFQLQEGKRDLYRLFIEKTFGLMKENSISCFIIPNTFLTIPSAEKLRRHIIYNFTLITIVNYDQTVFESASVNNIVYVLQKSMPDEASVVTAIDLSGNKPIDQSKKVSINQLKFGQNTKYQFNIFIDESMATLIEKIELKGKPLNDFNDVYITLGLQPYHNTLHTKQQINSRFLHNNKKVNKNFLIELGGKNVHKYYVRVKGTTFLDYSAELYTKPDLDYFMGKRIILREIVSDTLIAGYTNETALFNKSCYIIKSASKQLTNKYLLGLVNSKVLGFYVKNTGAKSKQILFPRITMQSIKKLPIVSAEDISIAGKIELFVDRILKITESDNYLQNPQKQAKVKALEAEIDQLVYKLYGLTPEEIKIVEGENENAD